MRLARGSFLLFTILTCAVAAFADGLPADPKVIVGGGGDAQQITGNTFSFTTDSSGGGTFSFIAPTSGEDIFTLALTFAPTSGPFSCDGGTFFATCSVTTNSNGTITALFTSAGEDEAEILDDIAEAANAALGLPIFDNDVNGGIEEGQTFTISLPGGGWAADSTVTGVINPVPEPGTIVLLLSGLGLVATRRQLRKN